VLVAVVVQVLLVEMPLAQRLVQGVSALRLPLRGHRLLMLVAAVAEVITQRGLAVLVAAGLARLDYQAHK
jgi:hypothetical protein